MKKIRHGNWWTSLIIRKLLESSGFTIRLLFVLAAQNGWAIHQMDVKSTFLNGYLEEEIFVEQPEGLLSKDRRRRCID